MSILSRWFGKPAPPEPPEPELVPVPIPPLAVILKSLEDAKGAPLTKSEVLAARDGAISMMLPADKARKMAEARGFDDIDPANVLVEWQAFQRRRRDGV